MPDQQTHQELDRQLSKRSDQSSIQHLDQLEGKDHLKTEAQARKQPIQETDGIPIDTPRPRGSSIEGLAKRNLVHGLILINVNEDLEKAFKSHYLYMMDEFRSGDVEKAEKMAHELLTWENLPILYRTYAHVVLAYGPTDHMFHACKAVEEAEWGLNEYGDQQGVGTRLLAAANSTLADVRADAASKVNGLIIHEEDEAQLS